MQRLYKVPEENTYFLSHSASCVCFSRRVQQAEVVAGVAAVPAALLHRPQLLKAALGKLVLAVLRRLHAVDRLLLLHHGVDGEGPTRLLSASCR